ncbi:MAG: LysR family transcriptional regulator [Ilumatobacteraceae bacterium]
MTFPDLTFPDLTFPDLTFPDLTLLPDLTIRQMAYLVAVVDEATWAAAADRVGVSPSALSQGLAELERRLGVALFESHGRRRVLRRSALPVLDHARRVLALTRDLVEWSDRMRGGRQGRIRLGMIDVAVVVHFPGVVAAFRAERPDVRLTMSVAPSAELLAGLRDGELDLVVCVKPPEPLAGIDVEAVRREPLVVMAPTGTTIGPPSSWGPWLTFPSHSQTRKLIVGALAELGSPTTIAAESHQPDVLVQMVRLGLGWTVLPMTVDQVGLGSGDGVHVVVSPELAQVVIGPQLVERVLVLARRTESISDPAVDELARRLRA